MKLKAGIGVVLALVLAFGFWWVLQRPARVFESVVDPVEVSITPPQYVAEMPHRFGARLPGLVVRAGERTSRIRKASDGVWLDDGRYLVARTFPYKCSPEDRFLECSRSQNRVLDPASGRLSRLRGIGDESIWEMPGEGVHRVNLGTTLEREPFERLVSLAPDLSSHRVLRPPRKPDGPEKGYFERFVDRRVFTIGDWDYVRFSDVLSEERTEEYGYLRQRHGRSAWEKVLVGERLVALWVSRDGRALLGLQQKRGEPCGGCNVKQQIVEIDPAAGSIAATYGVPGDYDKSWRVGEIDKVRDRVLVRYVERRNVPVNLGVWQYDGSWSLVPGTDKAFTWWQGPQDRIEAVPRSTDPDAEDASFELSWVHGDQRTRLPGQLPASELEGWRGAPGSLVPLE